MSSVSNRRFITKPKERPCLKILDSLQKMFTIFEEDGEPLTERAKVDELLTKIQNSALAAGVAQLSSGINLTHLELHSLLLQTS